MDSVTSEATATAARNGHTETIGIIAAPAATCRKACSRRAKETSMNRVLSTWGFRSLLSIALCLFCVGLSGRVALAEESDGDRQLNQRVTLAAVGQPLQDVLAELSQRTGVSLDLHLNLRNQKVTVLVDEQPLRVVMNNLRDLLDAVWFTEEVEGKTGYYLKQKYGLWFEAARLRGAHQAEKQRREIEFRSGVRQAARIASLPRDELLAMLDTDPRAVVEALSYGWGGEGTDGLPGTAALAGGLSDVQWDLVFREGILRIPYNDLPNAGRTILDKVCRLLEANPDHPLSGVDPGELEIQVYRERVPPHGAVPQEDCVEVWTGRPKESVGLQLARLGKPTVWSSTSGWRTVAQPLGLTQAELRERLEATEVGRAIVAGANSLPRPSLQEDERSEATGKPVEQDDWLDLQLGKDLNLEPRESAHTPFPLESVLEAMHRKAGVQIVADSYVVLKGEGWWSTAVPKAPEEMVSRVAKAFGRIWTRDGDIFRMRSATWYEDDALEPPTWLIERLQAKVRREKDFWAHDFDLADLAAAYTALTDDQISAINERGNPYYQGLLLGVRNGHVAASVLRLYGSLHPPQQQRACAAGIGVGDLNQVQQAVLADCLNLVFKTQVPPHYLRGASLHLALEERQRQFDKKWLFKQATFVFTLAGGKNEKVSIVLARTPIPTIAKQPR